MSQKHSHKSTKLIYVPNIHKEKSGLSMTQQARTYRGQRLESHSKMSRKKGKNERTMSPLKRSDNLIVVPTVSTSPLILDQSGLKLNYSSEMKTPMSQFRPAFIDSRVMMINKACHVIPHLQDAAQYTDNCQNEQYEELLIQQYGFNPVEPILSEQMKPAREKSVITCQQPKVENSSQCANPTTTNTGTNGTAVENVYSFNDRENSPRKSKSYILQNIDISESPRLKVIAEKYTRFKKDRVELRQLEERIICVEYDVFNRDDMVKEPAQVMRAYFCVKTGCDECKGAILSNVHVPLGAEPLHKLETDVEIIDEKLSENKPYLKDLQTVLKKRQAVCTKKQKSTLDLMSMYTMAYNEMPPRDFDWSNTNLLSKAELDEVKHLIIKKCESRVHNLSRKKIKKDSDIATESFTDKTDSLCYNLLQDLDNRLK